MLIPALSYAARGHSSCVSKWSEWLQRYFASVEADFAMDAINVTKSQLFTQSKHADHASVEEQDLHSKLHIEFNVEKEGDLEKIAYQSLPLQAENFQIRRSPSQNEKVCAPNY